MHAECTISSKRKTYNATQRDELFPLDQAQNLANKAKPKQVQVNFTKGNILAKRRPVCV